MAPVVVVFLDPGGHPCPGLRAGGEVLAPTCSTARSWLGPDPSNPISVTAATLLDPPERPVPGLTGSGGAACRHGLCQGVRHPRR
jgi:hypothetical protein